MFSASSFCCRRVCPPSPLSALALQRLRPPSSAAWAEFLNASANGKIERDFALLTLTDGEQRELYEAARIIQNAFRRYKVTIETMLPWTAPSPLQAKQRNNCYVCCRAAG